MKQPWEDAVWLGKDKQMYITSENILGIWIFVGFPFMFVLNSWLMDLFVKTTNVWFFFFYIFGSSLMTYLGFYLSMRWFEYKKANQK